MVFNEKGSVDMRRSLWKILPVIKHFIKHKNSMIEAIIWVGVAVFIFCVIFIASCFNGCHRKNAKELATTTKMEFNTASLLDSELISITAFMEYMKAKKYHRERNRNRKQSFP